MAKRRWRKWSVELAILALVVAAILVETARAHTTCTEGDYHEHFSYPTLTRVRHLESYESSGVHYHMIYTEQQDVRTGVWFSSRREDKVCGGHGK